MTAAQQPTAPPLTPAPARELGRDLVVASQGNAVVPLPTNFNQMVEMAQLMSRGGSMVGKAFQDNPGACLGILQQAMRLGMDPYALSQKAYVASKSPDGPIGYEAQAVHAIVLKNAPISRRPRAHYSGEGPTRRCKVVFHVIGEDEPFEYESPMISEIKVKNSPLWIADPDQQLWYYSVRAGARRHFPDVLMGIYTAEEMDGVAARAPIDGGEVITLGAVSRGEEQPEPKDADFTPIDALLNKNGGRSEEPAAAKGLGDGGPSQPRDASREKTKGKGGKPPAGSAPAATAAAGPDDAPEEADRPSGDGATQPSGDAADGQPAVTDPAPPSGDAYREDEQLVAGLEAKLDPSAALSSRRAVNANRGALARIAETSPKNLAARAAKILQDWPAK